MDGALSDTGSFHVRWLYRLGQERNPRSSTLRPGSGESHRWVWALRLGEQREARAAGEEHDIY